MNASVKQTSTIGRPNSKLSDDEFGTIDEEENDFSEVIEAINPNVQVNSYSFIF